MKHASGQAIGERSEQQDAFLVDDQRGIYLLADGMGGGDSGAEAAQVALEAMHMTLVAGQTKEESFQEAHYAVRRVHWSHRQPGSTAVMLVIGDRVATIGNIGDSRCYRFSDGWLTQVTTDHNHPRFKNVLLKALGGSSQLPEQPDFFAVELQRGDRFLLCSDGLVSQFKDGPGLKELLERAMLLPLEEAVELLIGQPTSDNNTVMIVEV